MPDSKLEKHIKNKVDGHISPIDADALWNDIKQKQKKPVPYWWIGVVSVLFLLAGGLAFYFAGNSSSKQNLNVKKPIAENVNTSSIGNSKNNKLTQAEEKEKTDLQNNNKEQPKSKTKTDSSKIFTNTGSQNNFIKPFATTSKSANISLNDETRILNKTKHIEPSKIKTPSLKQAEKNLSQHKSKLNNTPQLNNIQILKRFSNEAKIDKVAKPVSSSKSDNQSRLNLLPESFLQKDALKTIIEKTPGTFSNKPAHLAKAVQFLKMRNTKLKSTNTLSITKPNLLHIPQKNTAFEIGTYFIYEYAFRQFAKANINDTAFYLNDSLAQSYIKARNDSETFVESLRAGLFLRKSFKQEFRITSGIEYAQLTERFNAELKLGQFTVFNELDSSIYKIVERTHLKKIYNKYKTVNVFVLAGKKFDTQPLSFWFDAGVAFNLKFDYSGQIFQGVNQKEVIQLASNEHAIFKDKTGLSYLLDLGFSYDFNSAFSAELGVHFQSTFSSLNQNYSLDTKYHYLGIRASLVKQFK